MNLIVAVDSEWGIGNKGELLERIKADLAEFRRLTEGKTVIYGSNTLATFPGAKPLKNRINIVLNPSEDFKVEGATVAHSIVGLFDIIEGTPGNELFVIGGASVYRQLLPYCDTAYVTKFGKSFEKDVWMTDLDNSPEWKCVFEGENQTSEKGLVFRFTRFERTEAASARPI